MEATKGFEQKSNGMWLIVYKSQPVVVITYKETVFIVDPIVRYKGDQLGLHTAKVYSKLKMSLVRIVLM